MNYHPVISGRFIKRLNRFVAEVEIDGKPELVHVKNTGRLKELLTAGARVYLEASANRGRKYACSLIAVEKDGALVNIDSQVPNAVVYDAILKGKIAELGNVDELKREVKYGKSRFDLMYIKDERRGFIEVKGVTLAKDGVAMFPDAPTTRGTKHVLELVQAVKEGYEGVILFLVQMQGCHTFTPHATMDAPFAEALALAARSGVQLLAYDAEVTADSISIGKPIPVKL